MLTIRELTSAELPLLTRLFEYNDPDAMLKENSVKIASGRISVFGVFEEGELIGELRAMYEHERPLFASRGVRAYLYAYRILQEHQGKGKGSLLLKSILELLEGKGYREFTVGVEDDNERALHIYQKEGFTKCISREKEEYQGDEYEYALYLKCT